MPKKFFRQARRAAEDNTIKGGRAGSPLHADLRMTARTE
jgi:hypothetical protein